jgi:filamentous hemagglutinin
VRALEKIIWGDAAYDEANLIFRCLRRFPKTEQERLTKAACYVVKCWAEYKPGSEEYTKHYVSQLKASQLQLEIDWVNQKKEAGLFVYTPLQKIGDAVKSDPIGG